jgi:hypothetical protein
MSRALQSKCGHSEVVFEGPVWSGFWALQAGNRDRDRSHILTCPEKTRLNHKQPVRVGCARLQNWLKLVLNQDRSQISPDQFPTSLDWFIAQMLHSW